MLGKFEPLLLSQIRAAGNNEFVTNAKREQGSNGGKNGDHRRMCYDDNAENLQYLQHL
jgi:hypothetical protein